MEIKNTKTENNLRSAISGEAQAAVLYEYFAKRARKDGFEEIANIFMETSQNEKAHAKIYWDLLSCIHTTDQNLMQSAEAELHEHSVMYPEFARIAKEEGFEQIANTFQAVAKIELSHEKRFRLLQSLVNHNAIYSKGMETEWICLNCGHVVASPNAPEICPVCKHPKAYFKVRENSQ